MMNAQKNIKIFTNLINLIKGVGAAGVLTTVTSHREIIKGVVTTWNS